MKTILKIILALSLVSSVLFGADDYAEQKEKIVKELLDFYNNGIRNAKNLDDYKFKDSYCYIENDEQKDFKFNGQFCCALLPDKNTMKYFPKELKKHFSNDFLNVLSKGETVYVTQDVMCYDIKKEVNEYKFICDNGECKIDDIASRDTTYKKAIANRTQWLEEQANKRYLFKEKLANYAKKYKVSKEFYEKFKTEKIPLILYFSDDLINGLNDDELEIYENYTRHFEAESCKGKISLKNGIITLTWDSSECGTEDDLDTYLIFACEKNECEIIDIGTDSCDFDGCSGSWLKK